MIFNFRTGETLTEEQAFRDGFAVQGETPWSDSPDDLERFWAWQKGVCADTGDGECPWFPLCEGRRC